MDKEKVVITGGAGFVGSHLAIKLLNMGYDVHVIDNLISGKKTNIPKNAIFHKIDICKYEKIKSIFKDAKYVFHLAALPSVEFSINNPIETNNTNVNGTLSVFKACSENKVEKIIFASSCSVYGDQKSKKLSEKLIPNPMSPYALQKKICEDYSRIWAQLYNQDILSLRFFNIYGEGQKSSGAYAFVISKFLKLKAEGKDLEIMGDGKQTRDFVHIDDVVDACIKSILTKTTSGDYINIGGGKGVSINKIAKMIGGKIKYLPPRIEPRNTESDNTKAFKILGWKPKISLIEGIKKLNNN